MVYSGVTLRHETPLLVLAYVLTGPGLVGLLPASTAREVQDSGIQV